MKPLGFALTLILMAMPAASARSADGPLIRQWANAAPAHSTQYGSPGWAAYQAAGPPNTPACGDHQSAWASKCANCGMEWIELEYETPVRLREVNVVETFNPGAVVQIEAYPHPSGPPKTVWLGRTDTTQCPGIAAIKIKKADTLTRKIRVYTDQRLLPGWSEIDAVEIVGNAAPGTPASRPVSNASTSAEGLLEQWATGAPAFSTQYGSPQWAATQATGRPDTPVCGDINTAWAASCENCAMEWIDLSYDIPVLPVAVRVHETFNPGSLVRIEAFPHGGGAPVTLWAGRDPNCACPGVADIRLDGQKNVTTRLLRIFVDERLAPGWSEIDAVQLIGKAKKL